MNRVRIRVPASTSNLGAGFDAIGLALDLHLTVEAEWNQEDEFVAENHGEGAEGLPSGTDNLILATLLRAGKANGSAVPGTRIRTENEIPIERGLGASAAATVAGYLLWAALSGGEPNRAELLTWVTRDEGHPDNAAPAMLGGLVCVCAGDGRVAHVMVPVADRLEIALCVPSLPLATHEARLALPRSVAFEEAVFNVQRAALLVAALATGDSAALGEATRDALHQRYRIGLMPGLEGILARGRDAGALGCFVSGAGSSVAALCLPGSGEAIAAAMVEAAAEADLPARGRTCKIATEGASVERI